MDEEKLEQDQVLETETLENDEESIEEAPVEDISIELPSDENKNKKTKSVGREIFEWVYTIVIAFAIAFLIKGFLFDIVRVDGDSMLPTLQNDNRLIVTRLGYDPHQGDIVILDSTYKERVASYEENNTGIIGQVKTKFFDPNLKTVYYVKRVIALPGQTVDIKDGKVYVDGKVYEDGYHQGTTDSSLGTITYPHKVPEHCVFVMGDNREHSKDSRMIGDIPYEAIMGKAQIRLYPFNEIGGLYK